MNTRFLGCIMAIVSTFALIACAGTPSGPTKSETEFVDHFVVDDSIPLPSLITISGYETASNDVNMNDLSPTGERKKSEMVLVKFDHSITSKKAIAGIQAEKDLRPADITECLAYGAALAQALQHTENSTPPNYGIVCLGKSPKDGHAHETPVLLYDAGNWHLTFEPFSTWLSDSRFLAVRT